MRHCIKVGIGYYTYLTLDSRACWMCQGCQTVPSSWGFTQGITVAGKGSYGFGTFWVQLGHGCFLQDWTSGSWFCVSSSAGCSLKVLADSERYTWIVL